MSSEIIQCSQTQSHQVTVVPFKRRIITPNYNLKSLVFGVGFSSLPDKNITYFDYLSCTLIFSALKKLLTRNASSFFCSNKMLPSSIANFSTDSADCAPKKLPRAYCKHHKIIQTLNDFDQLLNG